MSEITDEDSGLRRSAKDDSNHDDDDCGSNPSELYGSYTWNIKNFSQIDKPEIHSNVFDVGGFKWYILMYPHGCDVCNHISLFLCVANRDKLLPGWSHIAHFTISLTNKDPTLSKYSDTLHRFWKKEHDWGWKKYMELPKLNYGFIDDNGSLTIKAQVQVIRDHVDRPFRCLDGHYRRELVRVYLTNVDQIFRRFAEETRSKLVTLIEDKERWSSLTAYWLGLDKNARLEMCGEKMDVILKEVVNHFFIEYEFTSALVMDSLYDGLKSLEEESRMREDVSNLAESFSRLDSLENGLKEEPRKTENQRKIADKEPLARIVTVNKEVFGVVDGDIMLLVEKAVLEPFLGKEVESAMPFLARNSVNAGEKDMERDENPLIDLGKRILEVFVLDYIFCNKIETAYEEAMVLKMQEELIHEEEEEKKKINKVFVGKK